MLGFKSILYPALHHNYGQYLNALTALNAMVKGAELNSDIITPLVPKFLQQIIDGEQKRDQETPSQSTAAATTTTSLQIPSPQPQKQQSQSRVPVYVMNLFRSLQDSIDAIEVNVWLMIIDSYELMEEESGDDDHKGGSDEDEDRLPNDGNQYGYLKLHSLFIANNGWIHVDRLCYMCPNAEHIQLYNGNVQTGEILPCITLDESTMNDLLGILVEVGKRTKLERISFYNPDEGLLSINDILKHFTRWFTEIGWSLRLAKERAPFKEDQCDDVRTLIVFKQ